MHVHANTHTHIRVCTWMLLQIHDHFILHSIAALTQSTCAASVSHGGFVHISWWLCVTSLGVFVTALNLSLRHMAVLYGAKMFRDYK